jgi:hypothetical protein
MASVSRLILRLICVAALFVFSALLSSCSSAGKGSGGVVCKVKTFHLIPTERFITSDRSIAFERQYILHGAVTAADQQERAGQYYSFLWKVTDRTQPVTVKFQYRQANTGLEIQEMIQEVTDVRRSNWSKFQVTGPAYNVNGRVTAWKLTLSRAGEVLGSEQSYLWE